MTDPFERAVLRDKLERGDEQLQQHRTGLVIHTTVYVAVNILLVVVWALTWTKFPWFIFPLLGWGIGLAAHVAAYRGHVLSQRRIEAKLNIPQP